MGSARIGRVVAAGIAVAALAVFAWLIVGALSSRANSGLAQREVQRLYDETGLSVAVIGCRPADEHDGVDSPYEAFRCEVRTPRCERSLLFNVPRAAPNGGYDVDAEPFQTRLRNPCLLPDLDRLADFERAILATLSRVLGDVASTLGGGLFGDWGAVVRPGASSAGIDNSVLVIEFRVQ